MKTKTMKRLAAAVAAITMMSAVPMMSMTTVMADGPLASITIDNANTYNGTHAYTAYQIFTGDVSGSGDNAVLSNVQWGNGVNGNNLRSALIAANIEDGVLKGTLSSIGADSTAADIAKALSGLTKNSQQAFAVAALVENNKNGSGDALTPGTAKAVTPGYYLIIDNASDIGAGAESARILEVFENETVTPKIDYPTIDKVINEGSGVKTNTASIGDTIPYKLTSDIPDMTGYTKYLYVVKDTLAKGITFDSSSLVVKVDKNADGDFEDDGEILTSGYNGIMN